MALLVSRLRTVAAACLAVVGLAAAAPAAAEAQDPYFQRGCPTCRQPEYGNPDLFYNYFVPPNCGGVGANLYLSPGPVPPHVGHTYVTYQPFMPHEYLYSHHRTYHRYYDEGRGLTRTHVSWHHPPGKAVFGHIHHGIKLAR